MEWMRRCQTAREWFKNGCDRGASHLVIFYDFLEKEYRPYFVFPEQEIEIEVIKIINRTSCALVGVLSLSDDVTCVDTIFRPISMAISRVEN
jgi:hypothetical protein